MAFQLGSKVLQPYGLESLENFQAGLQDNSIQQLISQHNPQIDPLAP